MAKGFVEELVDNVIEKDDEQTIFRVPSKRENLVLRVDNDLLSKFSNGNAKLERCCGTCCAIVQLKTSAK